MKKIIIQDNQVISAYGFDVGQNVFSKVDLIDENENKIKKGAILRIVAIAPKVRHTNPWKITNEPDYNDSKDYFYNAVLAKQKENWSNRIRANFVTISDFKPLV